MHGTMTVMMMVCWAEPHSTDSNGENSFMNVECLWILPPYPVQKYTHFWTGNIHPLWLADSASLCSCSVTNCLHLSVHVCQFLVFYNFFLTCLIIFQCV